MNIFEIPKESLDMANAFFEGGACLFVMNHIRVLFEDRESKGVSALSIGFFFIWGIFNLLYYPHLDQMYSFYASIGLVLTNFVYVSSIVYFRHVNSKPRVPSN